MSQPSDTDAVRQLEFLRQIQRILDEGQFVASYKYALLMAVAELAVEGTMVADGSLPLSLSDIAERVIEIYWPQVAPFREGGLLEQTTGRPAVIIGDIHLARSQFTSLAKARRSAEWVRLVRRVRSHIVKMPLWKLQTIGGAVTPFLYESRIEKGDVIVLQPGVASSFRALAPVVNALLQAAWIRYLNRLPANRALIGPGGDLSEFLFGSERNALSALSGPLRELQSGECFYCGCRLSDRGEVDHFVPWVKYPRDLGHNFVLAHGSCNRDKSDYLADIPHLEKWVRRNQDWRAQLNEIFRGTSVMEDANTSMRVAEWAYENASRLREAVWHGRRDLRPLSDDWRGAFVEAVRTP